MQEITITIAIGLILAGILISSPACTPPHAQQVPNRTCVVARYDLCVKAGNDPDRCAVTAREVCME